LKSSAVTGHLFGGWEISGIAYAQTGLWLTVNGVSIDPAGLGLADFNSGPYLMLARINTRTRTITRRILSLNGLTVLYLVTRPRTAFALAIH
jgi:hypothetical protein